jgi:hypothetical protein
MNVENKTFGMNVDMMWADIPSVCTRSLRAK